MLASYSNATCDDRNFEKADQCGCRVKDSFIPLANGALPPYLAGADAITEMPIFTHEILLIDERIKNKYRGKEFEGKNLLVEEYETTGNGIPWKQFLCQLSAFRDLLLSSGTKGIIFPPCSLFSFFFKPERRNASPLTAG